MWLLTESHEEDFATINRESRRRFNLSKYWEERLYLFSRFSSEKNVRQRKMSVYVEKRTSEKNVCVRRQPYVGTSIPHNPSEPRENHHYVPPI